MLIGILSDTHGLLREELIDNQSIIDRLRKLSPALTVVKGNADKEWAEDLPQEVWLEILGNRIFVIHNKSKILVMSAMPTLLFMVTLTNIFSREKIIRSGSTQDAVEKENRTRKYLLPSLR